jgi:hypothetical protein
MDRSKEERHFLKGCKLGVGRRVFWKIEWWWSSWSVDLLPLRRSGSWATVISV